MKLRSGSDKFVSLAERVNSVWNTPDRWKSLTRKENENRKNKNKNQKLNVKLKTKPRHARVRKLSNCNSPLASKLKRKPLTPIQNQHGNQNSHPRNNSKNVASHLITLTSRSSSNSPSKKNKKKKKKKKKRPSLRRSLVLKEHIRVQRERRRSEGTKKNSSPAIRIYCDEQEKTTSKPKPILQESEEMNHQKNKDDEFQLRLEQEAVLHKKKEEKRKKEERKRRLEKVI